jgi:hypothetical protein
MKITLTNMMIRRRRLTSMVIRTTMPNSPLPVVVAKFAGGPAGMVLGAMSRIIHYGFRDLFDEVAWWPR